MNYGNIDIVLLKKAWHKLYKYIIYNEISKKITQEKPFDMKNKIIITSFLILISFTTALSQNIDSLTNLANKGNAGAQNKLGYIYFSGKGIQKDLNKAFYWYKKSAKQGDAEAQFYLGFIYQKGEGVDRKSVV